MKYDFTKPLIVAATALALVAPAYAQTPAQTPPPADAAAPAADAADAAAGAAEKAGDAAAEAGDAASDAADAAAGAAEEAGEAAKGAADAAAGADAAADQAAMPPADPAAMPADAAAQAPAEVAPPADAATPEAIGISASDPGMLGSWIRSQEVWTTNQPNSTVWEQPEVTEVPAEWTEVAKVGDFVLSKDGQVVGYLVDVGGFLGIGAKKVLLSPDQLHYVKVEGGTAPAPVPAAPADPAAAPAADPAAAPAAAEPAPAQAFFVTNYTKEELKALPEWDDSVVMK